MASDNVFGGGVCDTDGFDIRFQWPFSMVIAGSSNSGKTFFVKTLLQNAGKLISKKTDNIVFIYSVWQPLYDDLLKMYNNNIKFIEGIPQTLDDDFLFPVNKTSLVIIDDFMLEASSNKEVEKLFTVYVHHKNVSVIYILQNLFVQGKSSRTISLNTNYLVIFRNSRDASQIGILAKQMYPNNTKYFMESYEDASSTPYGYLLIDYKAKTPEQYRLRTGLLSPHPVVYLQKKKKRL